MSSKKKTSKQAPKSTETAEVQTPQTEVQTPPAEGEQATPARKGKAKEVKGRISAICAAARVLARKGEPMSCKELIDVMAARGLWTSPGGKTPHATLYAAILREIQTEGKASRFIKVGRGLFTINPSITEEATPKMKAGKAKKAKGDEPKEEIPDPTERSIPDGTEGPESLKELFRI